MTDEQNMGQNKFFFKFQRMANLKEIHCQSTWKEIKKLMIKISWIRNQYIQNNNSINLRKKHTGWYIWKIPSLCLISKSKLCKFFSNTPHTSM